MSLLKLNRLIQPYDYGYVLPLIAKLPISLGYRMAQVRGILHALLDYDWRSNSLNLRYVRTRVFENMRVFSARTPLWGTLKRFMNNSVEEWQSCLFRNKQKMGHIARQCYIDHLDIYRQLAERKRGVVLVSAHFDSFCMGMVLIGMNGFRVHGVNSKYSVEDSRIALAVRSHFKTKYIYMESLMKGKVASHEDGMDFFYEKLNNGDIVVLMGDIPGSRSTICIDFLGKKFRLPLGAWHMARKTNCLLGAYVTLGFAGGKFHTVCIPPYEPDMNDPVMAMMPIYTFLESWLMAYPEKWVASDLLQGY